MDIFTEVVAEAIIQTTSFWWRLVPIPLQGMIMDGIYGAEEDFDYVSVTCPR